MAKKKIKLDLSGGWRDVLEQAIDVNDVYAIESDLEDETALEITDRNFIIFSKLIHYIREDDTILFSPSEIRILQFRSHIKLHKLCKGPQKRKGQLFGY